MHQQLLLRYCFVCIIFCIIFLYGILCQVYISNGIIHSTFFISSLFHLFEKQTNIAIERRNFHFYYHLDTDKHSFSQQIKIGFLLQSKIAQLHTHITYTYKYTQIYQLFQHMKKSLKLRFLAQLFHWRDFDDVYDIQ